MPNESQNLIVSTLADGATAQLRRVVPMADRATARPIYDELRRIAAQMARQHNFERKTAIRTLDLR